MEFNPCGPWQMYWGIGPLPEGATVIGTIRRGHSEGALMKLASGIYVQGNAGAVRTLPQAEVSDLISKGAR